MDLEKEIQANKALDQRMMELAFREAERAFEAGEVPIGAVVVRDGKPIGRGRNAMEGLKDPTAHAEIISITAACNSLNDWRLDNCTLYVTLEPCPMCAGAILNSRIARIVYAAPDQRLGACGTTIDFLTNNPINRPIIIDRGPMEEESIGLLQQFFRQLRLQSKERQKQLNSGKENF